MKPVVVISTVLLAATALAQTPSATDLLTRLEAQQKTVKDFKARATGTAVTGDDRKLKIDLEVQSIPSLELTRIKFNAPDELADNFVIVDKDKIYNYLFLTNQVTITTRKANQNVGGFSFDFSQFSSGTDLFPRDKVTFKPVVQDGKSLVLEATPKAGADLDFGRVKAWIQENPLQLERVQYYNTKNALQADITLAEYKTNVGLKAAALRQLPKDAEIIKK